MPSRKRGHTVDWSCGLIPASHENVIKKRNTNVGSSSATGFVPGVDLNRIGTSNAVEWECGLSRKSLSKDAGASGE